MPSYQWLREVCRRDDLHEQNLGSVNCSKPGERLVHGVFRIFGLPRRSRWVGKDFACQVECVKAETEIPPIDPLYNIVRLLPGVDVCSPRQRLVRNLHLVLGSKIGDHSQIIDYQIDITADLCGTQEGRWDRDDICTKYCDQVQPMSHLGDSAAVQITIPQAFVVHEWLQALDGYASSIAP